MPSDLTSDERHEQWIGVGFIASLVVIAFVAVSVGWITLANRDDIAAIRASTETPALVDEWIIESDPPGQEAAIGNGPLGFRGLFVCSAAAVAADPIVQFSASFSPVGTGGLEVPRPQRPPRPISTSCSPRQTSEPGAPFLFVEFGSSWETQVVDGLASITEPTEYVMIFSVESDGWVGKTTITDPFTLLPAQETPS